MRTRLTRLAFTFALISGCVSQPASQPKTAEQLKQERIDFIVSQMKMRGASQAEIDQTVSYMKLSYEDQLNNSIKPSYIGSSAENLVVLIENGQSHCDLQRNALKIPVSVEFTNETKLKLAQCATITSRIVNNYYYKYYVNASASENVRSASDETYLRWKDYINSITQGSPFAQEQASLLLKSQINKFEQIHLREITKKSK